MESVTIVKEYEKGLQTARLVVDDDDFETIQIMDEMRVNIPVWEGDVHQTEQLIELLTKAVRDAK